MQLAESLTQVSNWHPVSPTVMALSIPVKDRHGWLAQIVVRPACGLEALYQGAMWSRESWGDRGLLLGREGTAIMQEQGGDFCVTPKKQS